MTQSLIFLRVCRVQRQPLGVSSKFHAFSQTYIIWIFTSTEVEARSTYLFHFLISFFRFSKSLGYQLLSEKKFQSIKIGDCYRNNWWHFDGESWNKKTQSKQANRLKRNRTRLTKSSLVLILNIDGWEFESGATKANPHYLRHSTGNYSVYHSENLEIPELHSWKYIFSSNHWLWF